MHECLAFDYCREHRRSRRVSYPWCISLVFRRPRMRTMQREKLGQRVVPLAWSSSRAYVCVCVCVCVHARWPEAAENQRKMAWLARCEKRRKGRENWRKKREETVGRTGSWQTRRLTARDPGHSPRFYKQPNTRTSGLLRFLRVGCTFLRPLLSLSLSLSLSLECSINLWIRRISRNYIPIFHFVAWAFPQRVCNVLRLFI